VPRFRLLPKVNSLRVSGKRYIPGEEVVLTEAQASRLNPDIFVRIDPATPKKQLEAIVVTEPAEKETQPIEVQEPKKVPKRSGLAGRPKP